MKIKTEILRATVLGLAAATLASCNGAKDEVADAPVAAEVVKAEAVRKAADEGTEMVNAKSKVPKWRPLEKLPDGERTFARAIVKSDVKSHLQQFDDALRVVLGVATIEEYEIGCVEGCDKFSAPDPLTRTLYVFPREYPDILSRFAQAWDTTQRSVGDKRFRLEFDADPPSSTCTSPQDPPPCSSMPWCLGDYCGRKPTNQSSCGLC